MSARRQLSAKPDRYSAPAEPLLETTGREVAEMSAADVIKLVEDLQLHQIELQMQNDQLRQTQRELEEARDRYADLFDFAPTAYLTLNLQSEILEANLNAGELLGLEPSRLLHQKFTRFVPAAAQDTFYLFCRQVFSSDVRQSLELELVNARAKRLFVHVEAVRDATSPRMQCRFSFNDISERKQLEQSLRESQNFAHSVVDSLAASIAIVDESGRIVAVNQRWRDFATRNGAAPEAVSEGANYLAACTAGAKEDSEIATIAAGLHAVLAGECPEFHHEYACHSPTEQRWFAMRVTPLSGQVPRQLVVAHEDITTRKRAEAALRESVRFNQQIIADAKEGIIVYDRDLKYLVWNPFMEQLTGLSAAEVIGKQPLTVFPFLQAARVIDRVQAGLAGKECAPVEFHFQVPQSGRSGWVSDTNSPLRNAQGEVIGVIGVVSDITERKRIETRITQLSRLQAILVGVDHAIVHIADRQKFLREVCRVAVKQGGFKLAWIGLVTPDAAVQPVAKAGVTQYLKGIRVVTRDEPAGRGPVGTAIRENRRVVIEEVVSNPSMAPWRERARQFGLNYVAALPIRIAGQAVGAFVVYAPHAGFFDESELDLLTQVSEEISFALAAMADLVARKQAEAGLRQSEHDLSIFFNQAPIGLAWLSANGTILRANLAQLDLLGYAAPDYLGKSFIEFCVVPAQGHELLKRLAAKETVRNFPMSRRRQDGTIRQVLVDAVALWREGQFHYSSVFLRDITDRIELEREILQAGERERRRIAQDLHDGLGQLLAGTAYLASNLRDDLAAKSPREARRLGRILEVINEATAQTRTIASGLHPVEAEPNGLMAALMSLAARTKKLFQLRCHFRCPKPVLLQDNLVATHLFRIAQEAITNAIKHGKPGRIEIGLSETPGRICLAIKDNGTGVPARPRKQAGMGLRIMRYRAGMIGGSLVIQKRTGGGTTVVCTAHLSSDTNGDHPSQANANQAVNKKEDYGKI